MYERLVQWIETYHLASLADVSGLILTIIGFSITIWNVRKSRFAAEEMRKQIYRIDTIAELSLIVSGMEEIKNLMRMRALQHLPFRFGTLRTRLVTIRAQSTALSDEDKSLIQGAITQFLAMERKIDRAIELGAEPTAWARDNSIISEHLDKVHALLTRLKTTTGGGA